MRFVSGIALSAAFASVASAEVSFSLGFDPDEMTMRTLVYECGEEQTFAVHYLNSETNVLALVPVDGAHRLFVNAVSASGVRYVSGLYEWWTKGETARLTDVVEDKSLLECKTNIP